MTKKISISQLLTFTDYTHVFEGHKYKLSELNQAKFFVWLAFKIRQLILNKNVRKGINTYFLLLSFFFFFSTLALWILADICMIVTSVALLQFL